MALNLYADGVLSYNSRIDKYKLIGLKTTTGLRKAGTAEIIMPPGHPAYFNFTSYRTVVELYEGTALRFRGRALYPKYDFSNILTITCEGERGFLRDVISPPFLYQDSPAAIFATALAAYNAEADPFKRFTLGEVTVTDPNEYIRLENADPVPFSDLFDKLEERCGGYITFTDDGNGGRAMNWLAEIGTQSGQAIEFGENLLEFTRDGQSSELATAIRPYGAQMEEGGRLTITSVTENGADWIQDDEARELRGLIMATKTWDDVTDPNNLLAKAQQWLDEHKLAVTSLQLTAADLSIIDKNVDSYHVGDRVKVRSKPHGVDEWFQLTDRTVDWLHPDGGKVTLGKTQASLTGADVLAIRRANQATGQVKTEVVNAFKGEMNEAIQASYEQLASMIEQTATSISQEVSEAYMTGDDVTSLVASKLEQLAESFTFTFTQLQTQVEEIDGEARTKFEELHKYIRFDNGDILIGEDGSEIVLRIENDVIRFLDGGAEVAYISNKKLFITDAHFLHSLRVGNFEFLPRKNGNLSLVKVSG